MTNGHTETSSIVTTSGSITVTADRDIELVQLFFDSVEGVVADFAGISHRNNRAPCDR